MSDIENNNVASPLLGEGIRGDGQAKWYVCLLYTSPRCPTPPIWRQPLRKQVCSTM